MAYQHHRKAICGEYSDGLSYLGRPLGVRFGS